MPPVSEVCGFLNRLAPIELAEKWDNVGLLIGRRSASVQRILTCLTLTPDVASEAVTEGVQLIISHHPVLFGGAKSISDQTVEGRMLLELIEAGIAVYSAHTRFDSARLGVNQCLAEGFGLEEIVAIRPSEILPGLGSGRTGCLNLPCSLNGFLKVVRDVCQAEYVEYCGKAEARVERVAVACGAAVEFLDDAVAAGCDTFVTGEARFHSVLEARGKGINLVLMGHYNSERPAMESLARNLNSQFNELDVFASCTEADPLRLSH